MHECELYERVLQWYVYMFGTVWACVWMRERVVYWYVYASLCLGVFVFRERDYWEGLYVYCGSPSIRVAEPDLVVCTCAIGVPLVCWMVMLSKGMLSPVDMLHKLPGHLPTPPKTFHLPRQSMRMEWLLLAFSDRGWLETPKMYLWTSASTSCTPGEGHLHLGSFTTTVQQVGAPLEPTWSAYQQLKNAQVCLTVLYICTCMLQITMSALLACAVPAITLSNCLSKYYFKMVDNTCTFVLKADIGQAGYIQYNMCT